MAPRMRITDAQRRARLVGRHHLRRTASTVVDAVRGVVALHSSDPTTPPLGCWARVPGFEVAALDRALYEDRSLWRLHAMRRTLFVVPADEAAVVEAAAGRDVAARERRRLEGWLAAELGDGESVAGWLARAEARVLEVLAGGAEWRTQDLAVEVPELATQLTLGSGRWATRSPLSSRLLFLLAMDGHVVRTRPAGTWRSSQYRWAATSAWFGAPPPPLEPAIGRAELARRYLATHGPATLTDLTWWTGWTVRQARTAVADVGAVEVDLDGGEFGYVLPDDVEPDDAATPGTSDGPAIALLPGLDPTPMGWKQRDWYLGEEATRLFDLNGNVGPTVWADGRVVGGWAQRRSGEVVVRLLEDVGADASDLVDRRAAALTSWLDGVVVTARFPTPLERELRG